jgi:prepilin-type N-terminal cleavage/methylation domain-containing protein
MAPRGRAVQLSGVRRRRGYTIIEIMLVVALIAIMASLALPKVSFLRYRQDANGRLVQRTLILSQQRSLQKNTNVLFVMDYSSSRMRVVEDTNSNGAADAAERWESWQLGEGARFAIPTATVDGATAYYATGPGISTTANGPTITFYPNGSASGDAFLYIGVSSGISDALRAIEFTGATGRTRLWRYLSGAWRRDSL